MKRTSERLALYGRVSRACSRSVTKAYSTSFSWAIRALSPGLRPDIYAIYGFVRLADEIVDSFDGYDRGALLSELKAETDRAIEDRISINPILHAFQETYHRYGIEREHVDLFLRSMEWDLDRTKYDRESFESYIVGSAEVVGLMCLKVFVQGNQEEFDRLEPTAIRLGAAFQKVNFLRDLKEDYQDLGRSYFPSIDLSRLDEAAKAQIEAEIEEDLVAARSGIAALPREARFGVYLAYTYYRQLLRRIRRVPSRAVMESRIRVPDSLKVLLIATAYARHRLNLI
ncbi:MAG: phytoene synthase [Rhodothermales bacterium]|jgi:phytoene synthase